MLSSASHLPHSPTVQAPVLSRLSVLDTKPWTSSDRTYSRCPSRPGTTTMPVLTTGLRVVLRLGSVQPSGSVCTVFQTISTGSMPTAQLLLYPEHFARVS